MFKSCVSILSLAAAVAAIAPRQEDCSTIADLATATPELSTLLDLVVKADLAEALSDPSATLTVFAPTNDAFAALDEETLAFLSDEANVEALVDILTYHVHGGSVMSTDAVDGAVLEMLNGASADISVDDAGNIMINNANIVIADIAACSGSYVHVIDAVIMPPKDDSMMTSDGESDDAVMSMSDMPSEAMESGEMESGEMESGAPEESGEACKTVAELVIDTPSLSTLLTAVQAADLVDALSDPDSLMTVFAPTNDAFAAVNPDTLASLLEPENVEALTDILTYHVLPAAGVTADQVTNMDITMMNGKNATLTVDMEGVMINDANVVMADIMACGGTVVHVIDAVLIPQQE